MGGEDGGDGDVAFLDQRDRCAGEPFVKLRDDRALVVERVGQRFKELSQQVSERHAVVGFDIAIGVVDVAVGPERVAVFVELVGGSGYVDEQHARVTGDEPAPVMDFHAGSAERFDGRAKGRAQFEFLEFDVGFVLDIRSDEAVPIAPIFGGDSRFGAEDGVDSADLIADFPCDFEEDRFRLIFFGVGFLEATYVSNG